MSKYGVFSGPYFPAFGQKYVFSPNTGKYGPDKNSVFEHFTHWINLLAEDLRKLSKSCLETNDMEHLTDEYCMWLFSINFKKMFLTMFRNSCRNICFFSKATWALFKTLNSCSQINFADINQVFSWKVHSLFSFIYLFIYLFVCLFI